MSDKNQIPTFQHHRFTFRHDTSNRCPPYSNSQRPDFQSFPRPRATPPFPPAFPPEMVRGTPQSNYLQPNGSPGIGIPQQMGCNVHRPQYPTMGQSGNFMQDNSLGISNHDINMERPLNNFFKEGHTNLSNMTSAPTQNMNIAVRPGNPYDPVSLANQHNINLGQPPPTFPPPTHNSVQFPSQQVNNEMHQQIRGFPPNRNQSLREILPFPKVNSMQGQFVTRSQQNAHVSDHTQDKTESSIPTNLIKENVSEEDINWIDNWLTNIGKKSATRATEEQKHATNEASIRKTDSKIRKMMLLMAKLQQMTKSLKSMVTDSEVEWEKQVLTTLSLKNELKSVRNSLLDEKALKLLQIKIKLRRNKRERKKKQRKLRYDQHQAKLQQREKLHKELDNWQEKRRLKVLQIKQEKEMKNSADEILNEVRKKIADVTKHLDLHKALQKLRKLRKDRIKQQGVFTNPTADDKFDSVMNEQFEVLAKQKEIYLAEEKALKVMLETEQEDNKEKERDRKLAIQKQKQEKLEKKEKELIFGISDQHNVPDDIMPFFQYYDQANYNYESFIQIRRDWDSFLVAPSVPGASRIPDGWVLPAEASSQAWAAVIKNNAEN